HDDRIGARLLTFPALEEPAKLRLDAEHGKIIAADRLDPLAFGLMSGDAQVGRAQRDGEHIREDIQTLTLVAKVEPGVAVRLFPTASFWKHQYKPVRVLHRQRLEEEVADDREDRDIRADPEREREDSRRRESTVFYQRSRAVAQVLPKVCDHICPPIGSKQ